MREHRVTKGWTHVATNDMAFGNTETKQERVRREHKFNTAIRSMKVVKPVMMEEKGSVIFVAQNLIDEGKAAAAAQASRKASLMTAFGEKKLKSKALIREAKGYNKKQGNKQTKSA